MSQQDLIQLLDRYLSGTATIPEQERVEAWLDGQQNLNNDWESMNEAQRNDFLATLYQRILTSIDKESRNGRNGNATGAIVIPLYKRKAFRRIAAACVILFLGIATYVILSGVEGRHKEQQVATTHDVPAPTNTRAVITLANGSKVYLDSAGNGTIAQENNVAVVKNAKGEIVYNTVNASTPLSMTYNTLFNPRGSKVISLTLSDGTKVWLNSESSLKYPTAFNASTREVEITGEAYFEVQHNARQPFKVHLPNGGVIEDIGTAFNVNAYTGEDAIKTTLVEGAVNVIARSDAGARKQAPAAVRLSPGQQAAINTFNLQLLTFNGIDLEEVTAWKNGRFQFTDATIETILKEISRYYDAEIIYQDKIPGQFVADISRDVPVSKLLQILELTNRVHFRIEGKKITVMK